MWNATFITRHWRQGVVGAIASAALIVGACAQDKSAEWADNTSGTGSAPASANAAGRTNEAPGAITASQSGSAAQTAQPVEAGQIQVARAFPTGNRNTSDLLVEQIGPREVRVGAPYTYQLRVTNLTDQPLTGITLRQRVSDNFKLSQNEAVKQAGENGEEARIEVGNLGPRQSKTVEVTGTPDHAGTLDTCLSAQYNPPTLCAQVAIVSPQIKAVAEGPSQADVCQDLVYRYTATNTGTGTAHNVVLQEDLPQGLQTADGGKSVSLNVGDLGQGQSKTVTARMKATQAGKFTTRATVNSDAGQAQTEQIATSVMAPRLAVTITAPNEEYAGQPISYRVDVKNVGDAPAAHTRLRVGATPGQVDFVSAEGGEGAQLASEKEGGGQDLGTIVPGQSRTVTINFRPRNGGPNAFDATAQADCARPVTTSSNTQLKTITASALVVTHDPDPVRVGQNVIYHLTVQNKGNVTDHDIKVTATLPESEQFVRGSGKTDVTNDGRTITFGTIPTLEPKQTVKWDVEVKALRPDQANFKASMTTESTPNPAVKIEPTKLFGGANGTQTHTSVAPEPEQTNSPPAQQPQEPNK